MNSVIGAILSAATLERGVPNHELLPKYIYTADASGAFGDMMDRLAELLGGQLNAEKAIDGLLIAAVDSYERQGFINGFRYAFMLAAELRLEDVNAF